MNAATAAAKSLQSYPTLCDHIDGSPPGSPIPGILQARILEWVAISFSNAWKWKVKVKSLSHVRLLATPWTAAHQAPLSMGFFSQEYWSVVPLMSLLLNMLSRFITAFLPRIKHLLISWLQSLSAVILEPKKIKYVTVSIFSLSIAVKWWDQMSWSWFLECGVLNQNFYSPLSLSSNGSLISLHFLP